MTMTITTDQVIMHERKAFIYDIELKDPKTGKIIPTNLEAHRNGNDNMLTLRMHAYPGYTDLFEADCEVAQADQDEEVRQWVVDNIDTAVLYCKFGG